VVGVLVLAEGKGIDFVGGAVVVEALVLALKIKNL
jgi:hypothetical protein